VKTKPTNRGETFKFSNYFLFYMFKKHRGFNKSMKLFSEALKYIPGGATSNARLWESKFLCPTLQPCTLFLKKARGSHVWDVDGNEYIDYRLAFGPVILGHSHPAVQRAVHQVDKNGVIFGLDHEMELVVAKKLSKMVPNAEMVRYSVTGTEATMHSLRLARSYTRKNKIIKFEGHYHGGHDYLLFSTHKLSHATKECQCIAMSSGIPKQMQNFVIAEKWNDFEKIERTVKKNHKQCAAIITEPVMGNATAIPPRPGYLDHLKELCERYNMLLIFDEVKTGFRLANGGAQELFKVKPHLATFSKAFGNGYPISAITGRKDIMLLFGPGGVVHGGTFTTQPVSLAAANATLDFLRKHEVIEYINSFGKKLMNGIKRVLESKNVKVTIHGFPGMFGIVFRKTRYSGKITNFRDLKQIDWNYYSRLQYELLLRGVMIDEDAEEPMYSCFSHSKNDLQYTFSAFEQAIKAAKIPRTALEKARYGK